MDGCVEVRLGVLELFAGIGGFSVGLERTSAFKTIAFCEIDKHAQKILRKNWPGVSIYEDVKEITYERLQADGNVPDVITGGFPCQDISTAGRGAGLAGERSGLWFEFARIIKEVRPRWVIAENVSALRSRGLDQVLRSLAEIGYDAEWHCIPASAVGAPHRRDRIWIIAHPNSNGESISAVNDETSIIKASCDVAYPSDKGIDRRVGFQGNNPKELGQWGFDTGGSVCDEQYENVAYTDSPQCERGSLPSRILTEDTNFSSGGWWEIEPTVGRVADGVPGRTHRLKQLGNAVVPQIPEIIGHAIIRHMERG